MKVDVDRLNNMYCKDKTKYCGPGKEFENIDHGDWAAYCD